MQTIKHIPVLENEIVKFLASNRAKFLVDCTLGLGGHSLALSQKICPKARILALDMDKSNLLIAQKRLQKIKNKIFYVHSSFKNLVQYARKYEFSYADAILFDLGLSSPHLDHPKRGFAFKQDGPLDMRFDQSQGQTAKDIINTEAESQLTHIFKTYGEIKSAKALSKAIITERKKAPIETTKQLKSIITKTLDIKETSKVIPLIFQALRIAVNNELEVLEQALHEAISLLHPQGRLAVISYHSLEDRIVKNIFKHYSKSCICDKTQPICTCQDRKILKILTKKPITPTPEEIASNPRSRSAKLRVAKKT